MENIHELLDTYLWWEERSKDSVYLERKKLLIERDPLTQDFLKELIKYNPSDAYQETILLPKSLLGSSPEKGYFYKRPAKLDKLKQQIEKNWSVGISIASEVDHCLKLEGSKPLSHKEPFTIHHFTNTQRKEPITELSTGDKGKLTLEFDLSLLNKSTNAKSYITGTVWDIVRKRLDDRDNIFKDVIFSIRREDTFRKYLEWYDLHTQDKLGFRVLALYERQKDNAKFLERVRLKKIKWGISVKGEDRIEKAVKLIYRAIHKADYSRQKIEPLIEEYSCPTHKNDCTLSCKYLKKWQGRFNRLN